jgi:hypothetical protein
MTHFLNQLHIYFSGPGNTKAIHFLLFTQYLVLFLKKDKPQKLNICFFIAHFLIPNHFLIFTTHILSKILKYNCLCQDIINGRPLSVKKEL